ncbi:MAG: PilC/PilY family type IV pilus protein [Thermodesulfobacterium sp.]|nr:PilC/PilY family type IV pilus protein [Thermodesulfobacterium sp.]
MSDYCYVPPIAGTGVPPNVMLMLSIETPMQGAAHPDVSCTGDPRTSYSCNPAPCRSTSGGYHVSNCYDNTKTYYGYFDPNKCYEYRSNRFEPSEYTPNHQCSGKWSGNFLNWATMMAVDAFRKAMTGGNRNIDSSGNTQLLGARQTLSPGHSWFPIKRIDNAQNYTPYTGTIYLIRYANGFVVCRDTNNDNIPDCGIGTTGSGENMFPTVSDRRCSNDLFRICNTNADCGSGATCQTVTGNVAAFNLQIEVCNPSKGLEENCNPRYNKPEGVIQKYADKMRFGLISYAMHNNVDYTRDGGVIRANMKWIIDKIPYLQKYHDANGDLVTCNNVNGCPNPEREINPDGTFITNPDNIGGASYSGVINYINKFGYQSGYKSYDPISEMYYEIIRYFKKLGPSTNNYCNGLPTIDDGAPVYCNFSPWSQTNRLGWRDPYIYYCQKSFVVAINDANPWNDKRIPGTSFTAPWGPNAGNCSGNPPPPGCRDYGTPSNADTTINVSQWTDWVGEYEGITGSGKQMCIGCVLGGTCDWNANNKTVTQLSKAVGTCPYPPKENSYYIAGLAYYAHNTDLRGDLNGTQNLITYMIDTQESIANMLVGRYNMLYLAAKFGGFEDINNNGRPDLTTEWDKDGDGFPDNYFFASDPTKIEEGLVRAFTDILRRASSGATVATLTSRRGFSSLVIQPAFYSRFPGVENVSWIGILRAFWVDLKANLREDTNLDKWLNLISPVDKVFQFVTQTGDTPQAWLLSNETACIGETRVQALDIKPTFDAGCKLAATNSSERTILIHTGNNNLVNLNTSEAQNYLFNLWKGVEPNIDNATTHCIRNYLMGNILSSCLSNTTIAPYISRPLTFNVSPLCSSAGVTGNYTWKLGDIIYSTPSVVSSEPNNIYHIRYFDMTYRGYVSNESYMNRNSFVFVGANDGMLHAFRVGWIKNTGNFTKPFRLVNAFDSDLIDQIGKEEWAFIPQNALPYLVWYGREDYCHIPTIDYRSFIVDASIQGASNETKTVSSWRTLLVGVMGFGGKEISSNNTIYSSSVFVLDITDWLRGISSRPTLLWESKLPDNTLTLSFPAIIRLGERDKNGEWYLVIGSGPKNPEGTQFVNNATVYFFNLRNGALTKSVSLPVSAAVGDIWPVDVDSDYQDDVIYFGTYTIDLGDFWRLRLREGNNYKSISSLSSNDVSKAFNVNAPVFGAPITTKDKVNNLWVYFGTGRFLRNEDKLQGTNYFIAFKDDCWIGNCSTTYNLSNLNNLTNSTANIVVTRTESICNCNWGGCGNRTVAVDGYYNGTIPPYNPRGWYQVLENGTTYSKMSYSQPFIFGGNVETLVYKSINDPCQLIGETYLMAVCYDTGIPCEKPSFHVHLGEVGRQLTLPREIFLSPGSPPLGQPFQVAKYDSPTGQYMKFVQTSEGNIIALSQKGSGGRYTLWIEK